MPVTEFPTAPSPADLLVAPPLMLAPSPVIRFMTWLRRELRKCVLVQTLGEAASIECSV